MYAHSLMLLVLLSSNQTNHTAPVKVGQITKTKLSEISSQIQVNAELICGIKHAIKGSKEPDWKPETCGKIEVELTRAQSKGIPSALVLAAQINESDLRENVASPIHTRVEWHGGRQHTHLVQDHGLMGVRCIREASGRACINGPAKGYTPLQLHDPVINTRIGLEIILEKKATWGNDWPKHYNGGTKEHGYGDRLNAIMAAIAGLQFKPASSQKSKWISSTRMVKLTGQILAAVYRYRNLVNAMSGRRTETFVLAND